MNSKHQLFKSPSHAPSLCLLRSHVISHACCKHDRCMNCQDQNSCFPAAGSSLSPTHLTLACQREQLMRLKLFLPSFFSPACPQPPWLTNYYPMTLEITAEMHSPPSASCCWGCDGEGRPGHAWVYCEGIGSRLRQAGDGLHGEPWSLEKFRSEAHVRRQDGTPRACVVNYRRRLFTGRRKT